MSEHLKEILKAFAVAAATAIGTVVVTQAVEHFKKPKTVAPEPPKRKRGKRL